jgi:hypothetical protein
MQSVIGAEFNMTANTSRLSGTIFATIAALLAGADCPSAGERVATGDSSYCLQQPCPPDNKPGEFGSRTTSIVSNDSTSRYVALVINKSIALDLSRDVTDVFIANPDIANAVLRSSRRAYVLAKKLGQTNVYFYDAQGRQIEGLNLNIGEDHEIQEVRAEQTVTVVEGPGRDHGENGEKLKILTCGGTTTFCRPAEFAGPEKPPQPINVFPNVTSVSAAAAATK